MPESVTTAARRATNVSLSADLLTRARALGLNVSRACERGLQVEIAKAEAERWIVENREAIESANEYVERYGIPLAEYRQF